jgi:hypothetical protein
MAGIWWVVVSCEPVNTNEIEVLNVRYILKLIEARDVDPKSGAVGVS